MVKKVQKGRGFIEKLQSFLQPPDEQNFDNKKGITMCPECHAYYYEKAWHNSLDKFVGDKDEDSFSENEVHFELCPACQMKKSKTYEGEVVIELRDQSHREEVMNAVHNSDEQAREKNPMDRVLWVTDRGDGIHIFTSNNELAVKIGKKLDSAQKGGQLDIKYRDKEGTSRVVWKE